jgi:hypothetical protein
VTKTSDIKFHLRLNDTADAALADLATVRDMLLNATDECRVALEGVMGFPGPRVLGEWTPARERREGDLPGYVITYTPRKHPLRDSMLTMPRIMPFASIVEWRDAVLRAAEEWVTTSD